MTEIKAKLHNEIDSHSLRVYTCADKKKLDDWLLSCPTSMAYYAPCFHDFIQNAVGGNLTCFLVEKETRIVGCLPYFSLTTSKGTVINSLPWYGSHGGCFVDPSLERDLASAVRRILLNAYREKMLESDVVFACMILNPYEQQHVQRYQEILHPFAMDSRISMITPLPSQSDFTETNLEHTFKQKTRNLVRKSRKQGFQEVVTDEIWAWEFLHETHQENMKSVGSVGKPWKHFMAMRDHIPLPHRRLSLAMNGDAPVAALFLILFNKTIEYITPVIKIAYRDRQPLSFLIWHGMKYGIENYYSLWNWGGTHHDQESLFHFKDGFGSHNTPYMYLIHSKEQDQAKIEALLKEVKSDFPYYYLFPFKEKRN